MHKSPKIIFRTKFVPTHITLKPIVRRFTIVNICKRVRKKCFQMKILPSTKVLYFIDINAVKILAGSTLVRVNDYQTYNRILIHLYKCNVTSFLFLNNK